MLHWVWLPKNHAHNVKQNNIKVISLIDSHFVVGIVFELVAAFSTVSCGVVYPNLRHVPTKVLAEEIKTLGNKHSQAHEEDLEFSASACSQYEARLLAHAVDLSVESKRKHEEDKSKHLSNEGLVQVVQSQGDTREVKRDLSQKKEKNKKPAQCSVKHAFVPAVLEPVHDQVVSVKESQDEHWGVRACKSEKAMAVRRDTHRIPEGPTVFVKHVHDAHRINTDASEKGRFECYQWVSPHREPNHDQSVCFQVDQVVGKCDGIVTDGWFRTADAIEVDLERQDDFGLLVFFVVPHKEKLCWDNYNCDENCCQSDTICAWKLFKFYFMTVTFSSVLVCDFVLFRHVFGLFVVLGFLTGAHRRNI